MKLSFDKVVFKIRALGEVGFVWLAPNSSYGNPAGNESQVGGPKPSLRRDPLVCPPL